MKGAVVCRCLCSLIHATSRDVCRVREAVVWNPLGRFSPQSGFVCGPCATRIELAEAARKEGSR